MTNTETTHEETQQYCHQPQIITANELAARVFDLHGLSYNNYQFHADVKELAESQDQYSEYQYHINRISTEFKELVEETANQDTGEIELDLTEEFWHIVNNNKREAW